jgi:cytoskeletal protein CcmA (bactofilin family)
MAVPYTFANQQGPIPLNELDANFAQIPEYANTAGTVIESNQSNITAVGTLNSLSVSGNITAANVTVTGIVTTNASVSGNASLGNINTTTLTATTVAAGNITASGNATISGYASVTGNVTGGNLITAGQGIITGNITGGNLNTAGQVVATGNITGGNVSVTRDVAIGGNIVITGNATVNGTTTTINAQTLNITDKDVVVANNVATSALIDGAGIIAGNPTVSSLVYSHANLGWGTANNFNVGGNLTVTGSAFATTPGNSTSNTQVATTAFVQNVVVNATGSLGTLSTQNANNVSITGGNINSLGVTSIGNNSFGTRTVSSSAPSGGSNGDIWYKI